MPHHVPPTETLENLLACVRTTSSSTAPPLPLSPGDIIEVHGPPASGKTHLLYHFLITCITPSSNGGLGRAAVIFDTDATLNIFRFRQLLFSRLEHLCMPALLLQELMETCLKRLHVFRPTSSLQLAASILNLPAYYYSNFSHDEIGLVAIDSISAFYWLDRFNLEHMPQSVETNRPSTKHIPLLQHIFVAIQRLRFSHNSAIIMIKSGLNLVSGRGAPLTSPCIYRRHLFPSFSPFVSSSACLSTVMFPKTPAWAHSATLVLLLSSQIAVGSPRQVTHTEEARYRKEALGKVQIQGFLHTLNRVGEFFFHVGASY